MHNDYEDQLMDTVNKLLETFTLEELLEQVEMTEAEALVKLIMEGHIDETSLPKTA